MEAVLVRTGRTLMRLVDSLLPTQRLSPTYVSDAGKTMSRRVALPSEMLARSFTGKRDGSVSFVTRTTAGTWKWSRRMRHAARITTRNLMTETLLCHAGITRSAALVNPGAVAGTGNAEGVTKTMAKTATSTGTAVATATATIRVRTAMWTGSAPGSDTEGGTRRATGRTRRTATTVDADAGAVATILLAHLVSTARGMGHRNHRSRP